MPAPRGHKVPVPGDTGGASMVIDLLVKRAEKLGVQIRYETGATALVFDDDGRGGRGGVEALRRDQGVIRANAVVIAAGGFAMNPEMVAKYTPKLGEKIRSRRHGVLEPYCWATPTTTAWASGWACRPAGATKHMDQVFMTAPAYPPAILLTGIIVNKLGQRFVAEDSYHSRTSAFRARPARRCGLPDRRRSPPANARRSRWCRSSTAGRRSRRWRRRSSIPEGNLVATLNRYNEYAARGEDPDFHKQPEFLAPQDKGPWGAFDLSLGKAMYAGFTIGGLAVSVDGEVLREDGSVIPGLYAAGACASNIAQDGKGYASGTQLGEGSFFGRRAGAHAAKQRAARAR